MPNSTSPEIMPPKRKSTMSLRKNGITSISHKKNGCSKEHPFLKYNLIYNFAVVVMNRDFTPL
ncbi:hypothetical protein CHRYSEO8AT_150201 [Chryseobacterium sp. 8AT]|nr:hypothetical protein CHRYSEO8AT_150201 [Chryseobacterium sp. 8AT]